MNVRRLGAAVGGADSAAAAASTAGNAGEDGSWKSCGRAARPPSEPSRAAAIPMRSGGDNDTGAAVTEGGKSGHAGRSPLKSLSSGVALYGLDKRVVHLFFVVEDRVHLYV